MLRKKQDYLLRPSEQFYAGIRVSPMQPSFQALKTHWQVHKESAVDQQFLCLHYPICRPIMSTSEEEENWCAAFIFPYILLEMLLLPRVGFDVLNALQGALRAKSKQEVLLFASMVPFGGTDIEIAQINQLLEQIRQIKQLPNPQLRQSYIDHFLSVIQGDHKHVLFHPN
jgi:hypothetical protein